MRRRPAYILLLALLVPATGAFASTSHKGWPAIDGVLLMNKRDGSRPLDARPGHDPFAGQDRRYSCDQVHHGGKCTRRFVREGHRRVMTERSGHNELLGGHGSDTVHAGPWGDVLWGDYKPGSQPASQRDRLFGGPGADRIYASHGWNTIQAGGGDDWIKAHYGQGIIDCGGGHDTLYVSRKAQKHYVIRACETVSHRTIGY